jgi:hypothetical protein
MGTSGKSKRPPPRDTRADDQAQTHRADEIRRLSSRSMRAMRDGRAEPEPASAATPDPNVERLRAERAADVDDMAAMLVRLGAAERAREAAEQRALALETWTLELEAKVAEARTRGDDLEVAAVEVNGELARLRERVRELEGEAAVMRRDQEDALSVALEVDRVKRGLEREPLGSQRGGVAVAVVRDAQASSGLAAARSAMERAVGVLAELEEQELQANAGRMLAIEQVRRLLAGDLTTTPPPAFDAVRPPVSSSPVTLPRPNAAESSGAATLPKPSAPLSAPASPPAVTVPQPSAPVSPAAVTVPRKASSPATPAAMPPRKASAPAVPAAVVPRRPTPPSLAAVAAPKPSTPGTPAVTLPKTPTPATPAVTVPRTSGPATPAAATVPRPAAPPFPHAATAPRPGGPFPPPPLPASPKKETPGSPPPTVAEPTTEIVTFDDLDLGD